VARERYSRKSDPVTIQNPDQSCRTVRLILKIHKREENFNEKFSFKNKNKESRWIDDENFSALQTRDAFVRTLSVIFQILFLNVIF
jgi:hypothetical protein